MELKLKVYSCLCATEIFIINNINANHDDFGSHEDLDTENAEDYGCGDMTFTPKLATQEILDKYKINNDEYNEVCNQLESKLSFGSCGWCV